MMQKHFLLLYITGIITVAVSTLRTVHHNYHLIIKSYSWPNAQNYCREMYTDLATIITDDDWIQLYKEAASKSFFNYAWIGLYNDFNSWHWSLNNPQLSTDSYTNWISGEPNNAGGNEACGTIIGNGVWADVQCTILKPFICYNANFSAADKFIGITRPLLSWPDAQAYCRTHHTDLASSLNSSDNSYILQLRDIQGDSWIGLYRDTWKWSDGTKASNLPWVPGEPNNYYGNENCASHINNVFNDYFCSQPAYFYCHTIRPTRVQQVIKVQVKSDSSVFDPDVQSSILEQIKQKLKINGMLDNTTVTWKVKPDGNIFHKKNKNDL